MSKSHRHLWPPHVDRRTADLTATISTVFSEGIDNESANCCIEELLINDPKGALCFKQGVLATMKQVLMTLIATTIYQLV